MEENYQTIDESVQSSGGLEISPASVMFLHETRKWAKFLAILIFVFLGLLFLGALISLVGLSSMSTALGSSGFAGAGSTLGLFFAMLILSALYFFPAYYLLQFSNKMKVALQSNDQGYLEAAFRNLKSHYKFIGILAIVVLAFYLVMIIGFAIFGAGAF
jgi:hypothetical protein